MVDDLISRQAVIDLIHKTIYGFFDIVDDESEEPINEKDKLLLEVNKAVSNGIKELSSATDVVGKELYDRLLKNSIIISESLNRYQTSDVVEVVRCEHCFYAIPYNEMWTLPKKDNCMWCKRYEDARPLDWFCADGGRRE